MDSIVVDGVTYQKASLIAVQFGYTGDYVGQLCRKGKVRSRMVGRTWYVDPESVTGHREQKYVSRLEDKASNKSNKNYVSRIDVLAVPGANSIKFSREVENSRITRPAKVQYSEDTDDLLPQLSKYVPIRPAEAHLLRISRSTKVTLLEPESLPEVVLKGSLLVRQVPEQDSEVNTEQNSVQPSVPEAVSPLVAASKVIPPVSETDLVAKRTPSFIKKHIAIKKNLTTVRIPKSTTQISQSVSAVPVVSVTPLSSRTIALPALIVVSAVLCAGVALSLVQVVEVAAGSTAVSYRFEALTWFAF